MGIRIDELEPAAAASRDHELPAMKDDVTSKLTVGQIHDLLVEDTLGGDSDFAATMSETLADKASLIDANTYSGINTFSALQKLSKGADVASAATLTLGNDGNYFDITGTTTITSIAAKGVGTVVKLHFDAAVTLTHNATGLVLPGGANITTAAGDEAEFVEYATGAWRCVNYQISGGGERKYTLSSVADLAVIGLGGARKVNVSGWLRPATDNIQLLLQTSTNNGSSFSFGSSDYATQFVSAVGSLTPSSSSALAAGIAIGGLTGNLSTEGISFNIDMENFNSPLYMMATGFVTGFTAANSIYSGVVGGQRLDASPRNAIRLAFNSGNIAEGFVHVKWVS